MAQRLTLSFTLDLTIPVVVANLACVFFALGWFESIMYWVNFICYGITLLGVAITIVVISHNMKSHRNLYKGAVYNASNAVLMGLIGWQDLMAGYVVVLFLYAVLWARSEYQRKVNEALTPPTTGATKEEQ